MEWLMYMQTMLYRMQLRLQQQHRLHLVIKDWLKKYGFQPGDSLWEENEKHLRQIAGFLETIKTEKLNKMPYRPSIDPWKNSGLATHLRADFKARGITDRPENRPDKSPPTWQSKSETE